ncbi:hypothetical protein HYU22_00165 [Candidatus Woesearchaeota archaeon]|nr:hypothetical protein [Candidatus Woesearchaeota archaeon]
MKPLRSIVKVVVLMLFLLLMSPVALSAGGGGGGSSRSTPVVTCTEDTWSCSQWSPCTKESRQSRTCTLTNDCATANTPKPVESGSCTYVSALVASLKCTNLGTLRKRVECRLGLSDAELNQELKIQYLPEECRTITDPDTKDACIKLYAAFRKNVERLLIPIRKTRASSFMQTPSPAGKCPKVITG